MEDPKPTFAYLVSQIKEKYPNFAYIHLVEPRVNGSSTRESWPAEWSNDFIRDIWAPRPLISAGGYSRDLAMEVADKKGDLVAFGRVFIANVSALPSPVKRVLIIKQPDLPLRLKSDIPLAPYDRASFYIPGEVSRGYNDYPFATPN